MSRSTLTAVRRRLLPFLILLLIVNFLDRTNVSFAAVAMQRDLDMSAAAYGLGAGLFFVGYFLFQVPSNSALYRFGARRWMTLIVVTWGLIATLMAWVRTTGQFLTLRVLLGVAEAGLYPGILYYLSLWFPSTQRARVVATFFLGVPISQVFGAPLSSALMLLGPRLGVSGWRLMYGAEGIPAIVLGALCWIVLTDRPEDARWLTTEQRTWLTSTLVQETAVAGASVGSRGERLRGAVVHPIILGLALIYFGITAGSNAVNYFLPSVLQNLTLAGGAHMSPMTVGLLTATPYAFAAASMILWGRHSDLAGERRLHAGGAAMLAAGAMSGAFLAQSPAAVVICFVVAISAVYSALNVFWAIPTERLQGLASATGIGVINSIGNLSGLAAPMLIGWWYSGRGSYAGAFHLIAALLLGAGVALLLLQKGPNSAPDAAAVNQAF